MYETSDIRKGLRIELDNEPYIVIGFQFVSPGKGSAFTRTKVKHMVSGSVLDRTFKTGEKLKPADSQDFEMQYLYNDSEAFHFMNNTNYEQVALNHDQVAENSRYLIEGMQVFICVVKGVPSALTLPNFVVLEVSEAAPGEKGNTATNATKAATVSTGYELQVPLFINVGDKLRVDTRSGQYIERVK